VDEPLQQKKKPVPESPSGDSPPPVEPPAELDSDTAPSGLIAFDPETWGVRDGRIFAVRLPGGAAGRGPGPSGTRGGAA
jgi:hypothetical protein